LVVAIAEIGAWSRRLKEETAASLVGAGMASVLLFPIAALALSACARSPHWRSRNHLFRRRRGRRNRSSSLFRRGSTNRDIR